MYNNHSICSLVCNGKIGQHGLCCHNHVGVHADWEEFLKNLSNFLGYAVEKNKVFVEYEEGKQFRPFGSTKDSYWQNPRVYPTIRVDTSLPNNPCIFYDTINRRCNVYEIRPKTCRDYECDFLKEQKLVQLKRA